MLHDISRNASLTCYGLLVGEVSLRVLLNPSNKLSFEFYITQEGLSNLNDIKSDNRSKLRLKVFFCILFYYALKANLIKLISYKTYNMQTNLFQVDFLFHKTYNKQNP